MLLALGGNLGDRRTQLLAALTALKASGVRIERASSLYESKPMYVDLQPNFLNAVVEAETSLQPEDLLALVKTVERDLGRIERIRNGPRELDIDILAYGDERRDSPILTLPHPRMSERPFVLAPLRELRGEPPLDHPDIRIVEGPTWAGIE
ncbi:MAG: 2-amino-4-hydroxy-6-hydroxymethyldihydropteridine diphosphokinase [Chloroflexi bacterium]|nr:2-amino-4-hydroxy-6-hydroxymethyldihydropteridine diphosphokinase [Chloroflexota bacterium]